MFVRDETRAVAPAVTPWVVIIDDGFEAGVWAFADAGRLARRAGITPIYERSGVGGVDFLAFDASTAEGHRVSRLLEDDGWTVWEDSFRPTD